MKTELNYQQKALLQQYLISVNANPFSASDLQKADELYLKNAPKRLYKYYSDCPRNLNAVQCNLMWYSAPSCFNDVFDSLFVIDEDKVCNSILNQLPWKDDIQSCEQKLQQFYASTKDNLKVLDACNYMVRQTMGVSCFSERNDSILMWGHYTKNQGMCVEYRLLDFFEQHKLVPIPVVYSNDRPCLERIDSNNLLKTTAEFSTKTLTTKSLEWSYEREWRVIIGRIKYKGLGFQPGEGVLFHSVTPKAIYLGSNASEEFQNRVLDYCTRKHIDLYRMEPDSLQYKLNKRPILLFEDKEAAE